MKTSPSNSELSAGAGVSIDSIQAELDKILAGPTFLNSERLCRLLRFTVEQAIHGRGDEVKEYLLAVEVFDKDASFDPRIDSIVRVEAGRLRSRLREYYQTEGLEDPVRIEFRKGSYVPIFAKPPPALPVLKAAGLSRNWRMVALAVMIPLAVMGAFWASRLSRSIFSIEKQLETNRLAEGKGASVPPRVDTGSIAVLPFMNLSPEKDTEYFSDGLTEELIHALTKVDGLLVVAQTSAFQFKGKPQDIRKVGAQLRVATVVEGSVRKSGERLRVTVQLIRTADGYHLWSERYDREIKDVFAIQDDIARNVVDRLKIKLADERSRRLVTRYTDNLEAHHLYLKGRYQANKRSEQGYKRAMDYFHQAIDADPTMAPAWAELADCYYWLSNLYLPPVEAMPKAKAAALRALEIDETLAEAHAVLALVRSQYDWDWPGAGRDFRRAIQLNPGQASIRHQYGIYLVVIGQFEEALGQLQQAEQLDPLSLNISVTALWPFYYGRQPDRAVEPLSKIIATAPDFAAARGLLGMVYAQKSMYTEAIAEFDKASRLDPSPPYLAMLGHAYAASGGREQARQVLRRLGTLPKRLYVSPVFIATIHAGLGENDRAFEWLEKAYQDRAEDLVLLKVHPMLDNLRSDSRLAGLAKKMGLHQ